MSLTHFKASAQQLAGSAVRVQARNFSLLLDEPAALGGSDSGPTPIEALLGTLGACQIIVARLYAERFEVQLDDFRVEVEGGLDLDGLLDRADVRSGLQTVRYSFHIRTPSPPERVNRLVEFLQAHCPVGDSLAVPVQLELTGVHLEASPEATIPAAANA